MHLVDCLIIGWACPIGFRWVSPTNWIRWYSCCLEVFVLSTTVKGPVAFYDCLSATKLSLFSSVCVCAPTPTVTWPAGEPRPHL